MKRVATLHFQWHVGGSGEWGGASALAPLAVGFWWLARCLTLAQPVPPRVFSCGCVWPGVLDARSEEYHLGVSGEPAPCSRLAEYDRRRMLAWPGGRPVAGVTAAGHHRPIRAMGLAEWNLAATRSSVQNPSVPGPSVRREACPRVARRVRVSGFVPYSWCPVAALRSCRCRHLDRPVLG